MTTGASTADAVELPRATTSTSTTAPCSPCPGPATPSLPYGPSRAARAAAAEPRPAVHPVVRGMARPRPDRRALAFHRRAEALPAPLVRREPRGPLALP